MFVRINSWNDVRNNNETMIKQYVKQQIKHKTKRYSTRVSVRQVKEQHSEMKRSVKRKRKKVVTGPGFPSLQLLLACCESCGNEIWLPPRRFPYSSFRQTDERNDSSTQQEVTTVAEDHRDPENPDHSISLVCCRVMSSYGQVWNPWRVRGGIVTTFFLFRFTERFILLCCSFTRRTDTRVEHRFVLCFIFCFTYCFIIVSLLFRTSFQLFIRTNI